MSSGMPICRLKSASAQELTAAQSAKVLTAMAGLISSMGGIAGSGRTPGTSVASHCTVFTPFAVVTLGSGVPGVACQCKGRPSGHDTV